MKGADFERTICKQLGLWWTKGERDDVFWRSSNSGGRATIRTRMGKGTFGQYGDIQATDPIGQPLIDLATIELKRGYNRANIQDCLDKPKKAKPQMYEVFMEQCIRESTEAKTPFWFLIVKRDQRQPLIAFPSNFIQEMNAVLDQMVTFSHNIRYHNGVRFVRLEDFLTLLTPMHFRFLHRRMFHNGRVK